MLLLSRRSFLRVVALLPLARWPLGAQPAASLITLEQFLRVSERLTGRTDLDRSLAATYRGALIATPANQPLLVELARAGGGPGTAAHTALEATITEWWYTGVYAVDGQPRLATHAGALMWSALGMPAPGVCAGEFGAWSRPPRR